MTYKISKQELNDDLIEYIKTAYREDKPDSYIPDIRIHGRTLINLLGRAGNAIYKQIDMMNGLDGLEFVNDTFKVSCATNRWTMLNYNSLQAGKYYIGIMDCLAEHDWATKVQFSNIGDWNLPTCKHDVYENTQNEWHVVYTATYIPDLENNHNSVNFQLGWDKDGCVHTIKNIRLYEISKDEYDKINVEEAYTGDNIGKIYPYVDDVKCIVNPYLESKENLLDGATLGWYSNIENEISGDGIEKGPHYGVGSWIPVEPNTTYTLYNPFPGRQAWLKFKNSDGTLSGPGWRDLGNHITETSGNSSLGVQILFNDLTDEEADSVRYKATLTKGSKAKKHEECHNSRIMFETKLYHSETITRRNDGTYVKNSGWEEITLTNTEGLRFSAGYSHVTGARDIVIYDDSLKHILNKYMGHIINYLGDVNQTTFYYNTENKYLVLESITNNLTGWGDNYIPTDDEVKAFFLGWKMYDSNQEGNGGKYVNYNRTDGQYKAWAKLWCGIGEKYQGDAYPGLLNCINNSYVTVCPTVMNDQGYTPYRLIYKKEVPTIEEIKTYGSLLVKEGVDVKVSSGLVLGDKVEEFIDNGKNYVAGATTKCNVSNRVRDVLKVFDVDGNIMQHINIGRATAEGCIVGGNNQATYTSIINDDLVDYLTYAADTVTSFEYSFNKPGSVKESISRSQQEVVNCFEELARTKRELERTKEELAQRHNPNLLINGDFQVWQRGESFSIAGSAMYTADRWMGYINTRAHTCTISRNSNKLHISIQAKDISINNTLYVRLGQWIENPSLLIGKTLTCSIKISGFEQKYVKTKGKSKLIFGLKSNDKDFSLSTSGISALASINIYGDGIYKVTTVVPKDINKLLVHLQSQMFNITNGDTLDFDIDWVKLEVGEYPTPFIPRTYAQELVDCMYFYQCVFPTEVAASRITPTNIVAYSALTVPMRTTPTILGDFHVIDIRDNDGEPTTSIQTSATARQIAVQAFGSFDTTKPFTIMQTNVSADAEIY